MSVSMEVVLKVVIVVVVVLALGVQGVQGVKIHDPQIGQRNMRGMMTIKKYEDIIANVVSCQLREQCVPCLPWALRSTTGCRFASLVVPPNIHVAD